MNSVTYTRLNVKAAPGCANGWQLQNLKPGINVIHGPNSIGKSTTARAILAGLWGKESHGLFLEAGFQVAKQPWDVQVVDQQISFSVQGHTQAAPPLPAFEEVGKRCMVALHDLFSLRDDQIAKAILQDAAGGYDLQTAADHLGFTPNPRLRKTDTSDYIEALQEEQKIQCEIHALKGQQSELPGLEGALKKLRESLARTAEIQEAIGHLKHRQAFQNAQSELSRFDSRLKKAHPNDLESFEGYQAQLTSKETERRTGLEDLSVFKQKLAACGLPGGGVGNVLVEMRDRLKVLEELEREIKRLERELQSAMAVVANALQQLRGTSVDQENSQIDLEKLNTIAPKVREWEQLQGEKRNLEKWIDACAVQPATNAQALQNAQFLLVQWLKESTGQQAPAALLHGLVGLAGVLIAAAIFGGLLLTPHAFWGLLPAAVLLALRFFPWNKGAQLVPTHWPVDDPLPPKAWTVQEVQACLDLVLGKLAESKMEAEKARAAKDWENQLQHVERALAELTQGFFTTDGLGAGVDPKNYDYFLDLARRWCQAVSDQQSKDAELDQARLQLAAQLTELGKSLQVWGLPQPADRTHAAALFANLENREAERAESEKEIARLGASLQRLDQEIDGLASGIQNLFQRLLVKDQDELRNLLKDLNLFQAAQKEFAETRRSGEDADAFFKTHPGLERSVEDLYQQLADSEEARGRYDELLKRKSEIETRVSEAVNSSRLSQAIAKTAARREAVIEVRNQKLASLAGHLLAEHLQKSMGEVSMPKVFTVANDLFARFTHGQWQLLPPKADGSFLAKNTSDPGHPQTLDQLSGGTRAQLLLAVRTAFIQANEGDLKLPLLLDETLANSDDFKAGQIIEALLQLAKEGRQIFYFTAQQDEVGKWEAYFAKHPGQHTIIDLGAARGLAAQALEVPKIDAGPKLNIPAPNGMDYAGYGATLMVPRLNLREEVGSVHLWHLCEDAGTLHHLLSNYFTTWGQLQAALEGGWAPSGINSERLCANAELLAELVRLYNHGRGKPLTQEALEEAGISDRFIERVWEKARILNFDARQLMTSLEERGDELLRNMRQRAEVLENLRSYLQNNGYIPAAAPYDFPGLRGRLLNFAQSRGIEESRVELQLGKVAEGGISGA